MKQQPTTKKVPSSEAAAAKAYLGSQPPEVRAGLTKLCQSIRAVVPQADLGISYGIPAFRVGGRPLVWFAAFQGHSSFFPGAGAIRVHAADLKAYKTSKGTVQFPHGKPPSSALVARLVKTRMTELQKGKRKAARKRN